MTIYMLQPSYNRNRKCQQFLVAGGGQVFNCAIYNIYSFSLLFSAPSEIYLVREIEEGLKGDQAIDNTDTELVCHPLSILLFFIIKIMYKVLLVMKSNTLGIVIWLRNTKSRLCALQA